MKLLAVEAARARMLGAVGPLAAVAAPLSDCLGRVLAAPVVAARDQPPFAASAMDGYALRAADAPGALRVVGESAAGRGYPAAVGAGEAVRIFTGAGVPAGADTVVIQENVVRDGEAVQVAEIVPGANIRAAGGDFRAGETLLSAGTRMDPWRLALAAAAGCADLPVRPRPRVAILATGEEVVTPSATPGPFQIYDSGSPGLAALVASWGGEPLRARPVRDDLEAVTAALREAQGDLVVTLGGASVGDHDLVRAAGQALGLQMSVASVAVRPGKPTFFGVLADGRPMLGLPGNPASAFVCAELFLRPLLAALQGAPADPRLVAAALAEPLPANGPREHWMRARLEVVEGRLTALPLRDQDSSLVAVFAQADALLKREPGAPAAEAGTLVQVLPLDRAY